MFSVVRRCDAVADSRLFALNSAVVLLFMLLARMIFRVYRTVWRYTNTWAYFKLVLADTLGAMTGLLTVVLLGRTRGLWHLASVAAFFAQVSLMARLGYRLLYKQNRTGVGKFIKRNTAIVGAGELGIHLANDLRSNTNSRYHPQFFLERDKTKIGSCVAGLEVYDEAQAQQYLLCHGITEVIIAIADADNHRLSELYHLYRALGCEVRIFTSLVPEKTNASPMVAGTVRNFQIEDLLLRAPVRLTDEGTLRYYAGKTVMVTGGGGSIGSEICRQIAQFRPRQLIIVDNYENNAYSIQQELLRAYHGCFDLVVEIATVQDACRMESVISTYLPEVIFHAAAHKHVPLMEHCGYEAIKNNVFGTLNMVNLAEKYGAEKFILISTDKAVNPTNVMGATKRVCEMIVQSRRDSQTCFSLVRFGNVLGSNGSVIPLFQRQIAEGGPVTITDKRIIRYFMTIQEASQLVLQAGAMANRGEAFVLDMGTPVKIYDLAVNMIRLSGLEPEVDIPIEEVGLRPGEKLYEEPLLCVENLERTENELIYVERGIPVARAQMEEKLQMLRKAAVAWDTGGTTSAREVLMQVVPDFCDPQELNEKAVCVME